MFSFQQHSLCHPTVTWLLPSILLLLLMKYEPVDIYVHVRVQKRLVCIVFKNFHLGFFIGKRSTAIHPTN